MATDLTPQEIIEVVGHDGSQILDPTAPEPSGRVGFHIQEMVYACIGHRKTATCLQAAPVSVVNGKQHIILGMDVVVREMIRWRRGVAICRTASGRGHAVAFEKNVIYDPDGGEPWVYSYDAAAYRNLFVAEVWLIK
jgi:hypothetical protein